MTTFGAHTRENWCSKRSCADGEYYRNVLWLLYVPAGQRPNTSGKGHHCVAATWNTKLHWTGTLASKLTRPQSGWIWGLIQERVYQTAMRNIDELKERLIVVWAELKHVVDKAFEQWRPRLRACVQAKEHHFEHLIKWNITFSYLTSDSHAFHDKLLPNYNWLTLIEDFWKVYWCVFMGHCVCMQVISIYIWNKEGSGYVRYIAIALALNCSASKCRL